MTEIREHGKASARFGGGVGAQRVTLLTPAEQLARGLQRAIADCELARDRALEAAEAQTQRAAEYEGQRKDLQARLDALSDADT